MITTVKATFQQKNTRQSGRIVTPSFDYFVPEDGCDNSAERCRFRLLLQYACSQLLTAQEQQAVEWRYRQGKTLTQISRETDIPVSTLSRRTRNARSKLVAFAEQAATVRRIIKAADDQPPN